MFGRALKMAFWATYDNMGRLLVLSMAWALGVALPLSLGLASLDGAPWAVFAAAGAAWLTAWVLGAGLAGFARSAIDTHDPALSDFWTGVKQHGFRAGLLGLGYLAAGTLLVVSVWFYAARMPWGPAWLRMGLSAAAFWALVFLGLTFPFAAAALAMKPSGPWATWKLAAALTLQHPAMALGTAWVWLGLTVLCLLVPPLLVFVYGGVSAMLAVSAYEMLARRHAAASGEAVLDDADDDLLNRGLRDVFFPWKG